MQHDTEIGGFLQNSVIMDIKLAICILLYHLTFVLLANLKTDLLKQRKDNHYFQL